ncbi:ATPase RavA stimulator ViaA [Salinivibrio sp. SS2]|uniref:ATPase RavA stimulator ViaA n=1 Tax=Salinivibrio sp. SS2 TaxID=1892894 RepID=UPI00084C43AC|nr:ATPase RavA stimulator ViaA [Salinivibrio sp. DV]ODP98570.1 protein viaA [Salinivibrio sp. DV]
MLSAESLNMGLMLAESGLLDAAMTELMSHPQLLLLTERSPAIKRAVQKQLDKWRGHTKRKLMQQGLSPALKQEIQLYEQATEKSARAFESDIQTLLADLEPVSSFHAQASSLAAQQAEHPDPMFQSYFCNKWHAHLKAEIHALQSENLEAQKEKLLDDLYRRIATYQTMDGVDQSGDISKVGRLWDMAASHLSQHDVTLLKRFVTFLEKNPDLQAIAEQLGRMANQVSARGPSQQPTETLKTVPERQVDVPDDITGICQSDRVDRLLPNEAVLLSDPTLEVVFYKQLVDKQLLNYQLSGKAHRRQKVETNAPSQSKPEQIKGPFIIAVDASGSMSGFPEQCAKALAYVLMRIAATEHRDCYVMLFSTDHISYELTGEQGLQEAMSFLSYRFHGGTDMAPVIDKALDLMAGDRYQNADLVVVSDFIAPKQSDAMIEKVNALKAQQNRFHAVSLSKYGNPELMAMFDHCWRYQPSLAGRLVNQWWPGKRDH